MMKWNNFQDFIYELWDKPFRIFRRFKNAFDYAKFGFNTFDWDQSYFYELLEFKLKRMQKFFNSKYSYSGCKNTRPTIALCVNLLERINRGSFAYDHNYAKWSEKWEHGDFSFEKHTENASRIVWASNSKLSEDQLKKKYKELTEAFKLDEAHRQQDIDMLFDTMKKWSGHWWD